jgi:hypothetical protein
METLKIKSVIQLFNNLGRNVRKKVQDEKKNATFVPIFIFSYSMKTVNKRLKDKRHKNLSLYLIIFFYLLLYLNLQS